MGTTTFTYSRKNEVFWPINGKIWPKICIFGHFGPNISICGPFGHEPKQKTMRTRCLGGFSVILVSKLLLPPIIIRTFGQQMGKFCPKYAFLSTYRPCRFILCHFGWWLWSACCILHLFNCYSTIHLKVGKLIIFLCHSWWLLKEPLLFFRVSQEDGTA